MFDERIGQGREDARDYLDENPHIAEKIEKLVLQKHGLGPDEADDAEDAPRPVPN